MSTKRKYRQATPSVGLSGRLYISNRNYTKQVLWSNVRMERFPTEIDRSDLSAFIGQVIPINRTACEGCHMKFWKGESIITEGGKTRQYHVQCYALYSDNFNQHHIPLNTKDLEKYENLSDIEQKQWDQILFPDKLSSKEKYKIKLVFKSLETFTDLELQTILRKLDIAPFQKKEQYNPLYWDKRRAIKKIKKHMNKDKCVKSNQILVFGYCHEMNKLSHHHIPDYLIRIVTKYASQLFVE